MKAVYMISETGAVKLQGSRAEVARAIEAFATTGYTIATREEWQAKKRWQARDERSGSSDGGALA